MNSDNIAAVFGVFFFIVILLVVGFLPAIIAFKRRHHYKFVILALCFFSFSGIAWLVAIVWACWPSDKSLTDPVMGNVTGLGRRNSGDTMGAVQYGGHRGYEDEAYDDEQSQRPSRQYRDPYAQRVEADPYREQRRPPPRPQQPQVSYEDDYEEPRPRPPSRPAGRRDY